MIEADKERAAGKGIAMTIDWNAPLDDETEVERLACAMFEAECLKREDDEYALNPERRAVRFMLTQTRNRQTAPQYPAELVEMLAGLHDSLVLSLEYIPERTVSDFAKDNTAFRNASKWLLAYANGDLPQPVDPDLELARDCVASSIHDRDKSWGDLVRAGERDDCPEMRMVLAAIKRVRAEKG